MKNQNPNSKIQINLGKSKTGKIFFRFVIVSIYLSFVICHLSFAMDLPSFYSEEIVVTASRLPQLKSSIPWSVTVINREDLKLIGAKYLSDALTGVVGTDIISNGDRGALASVRLRGSSSQQVLVLIDGNRVNSPLNGGVDLSNYPVDEIQRIEIVRTPLSAVYGADAVGGVVNIITKNPSEEGRNLSITLGSYNEEKVRLSCNYSNTSWGTYINVGQHKYDGSRPNSQFSEQDYNIKFEKSLTETSKLGLEYNNYLADKRIPGSLTYPSPNASENDRNDNLGITLTASPDPRSSFLARIYQRNERNHYIDTDWLIDNDNKIVVSGIEIERHAGDLAFGIEARQDAGDASAISGYRALKNVGFYLQDSLGILDLGVREDLHSLFGSILTPRVGIKKPINHDISVSIAYSGAFRAPVLNELYGNYPADYPGAFPYLGNPNLKPEKGYLAEVSVENVQGTHLTAFYGKTSDLITSSWPLNDAHTAYSPININSITRKGLEFEYQQPIVSILKGAVNYTYQNCIDDATGDKVVYLPDNKANISLLIGNSIDGGNIVARYIGERSYISYPAPTYAATKALLSDFLVVDIHLFRKMWGVDATFGAENIFDRSYQMVADYPMPGRRFTFGMKYGI